MTETARARVVRVVRVLPIACLVAFSAAPIAFVASRGVLSRPEVDWSALLQSVAFALIGACLASAFGAAAGLITGTLEFPGRLPLMLLLALPLAAPLAYWWLGLARAPGLQGYALHGLAAGMLVAAIALAPVSYLMTLSAVREISPSTYDAARLALPPVRRIVFVLLPLCRGALAAVAGGADRDPAPRLRARGRHRGPAPPSRKSSHATRGRWHPPAPYPDRDRFRSRPRGTGSMGSHRPRRERRAGTRVSAPVTLLAGYRGRVDRRAGPVRAARAADRGRRGLARAPIAGAAGRPRPWSSRLLRADFGPRDRLDRARSLERSPGAARARPSLAPVAARRARIRGRPRAPAAVARGRGSAHTGLPVRAHVPARPPGARAVSRKRFGSHGDARFLRPRRRLAPSSPGERACSPRFLPLVGERAVCGRGGSRRSARWRAVWPRAPSQGSCRGFR
jgi:hypothetical protein